MNRVTTDGTTFVVRLVGDLYSEQYEFQIISKDGQGPLEVGLHGCFRDVHFKISYRLRDEFRTENESWR